MVETIATPSNADFNTLKSYMDNDEVKNYASKRNVQSATVGSKPKVDDASTKSIKSILKKKSPSPSPLSVHDRNSESRSPV